MDKLPLLRVRLRCRLSEGCQPVPRQQKNLTVNLTWTAIAGATGYDIERKQEGEAWQSLGSSGQASYADTDRCSVYHVSVPGQSDGCRNPFSILEQRILVQHTGPSFTRRLVISRHWHGRSCGSSRFRQQHWPLPTVGIRCRHPGELLTTSITPGSRSAETAKSSSGSTRWMGLIRGRKRG